ncbi:Metallo-dependent phosphatase-like protein [Dunaliella salina]|uniref:Purple acid phosphatase n=1 Tax=Dunaliella salina TaxID=3046 RepID=A0ABQ7GIZ1_DUNSA|nr:Metallo-dependent phosphatase-like protein [Dunaliella salina]|eukprot:KAF5834534.1 Metallo-dependent phosphatase-like protein [Dunaliella salina]
MQPLRLPQQLLPLLLASWLLVSSTSALSSTAAATARYQGRRSLASNPIHIDGADHELSAAQQQWDLLLTAHQQHQPLNAINVGATKLDLLPGVHMRVSTTTLQSGRGTWVEVSWDGLKDPKYDDWIALYVPAHADLTSIAPAKFQYAFYSRTHIRHGSGMLRFKVISYRQDMVFALVRGGLAAPSIGATTPVIHIANPNEPLQVHLALTNEVSEMLVQWVTQNSSNPVVRWGENPEHLKHQVPARTFTYARSDMCGGAAAGAGWLDPGAQHMAVMTGLKPSARVFYQVGDEAHGFSPVASFMARPPPRLATVGTELPIADHPGSSNMRPGQGGAEHVARSNEDGDGISFGGGSVSNAAGARALAASKLGGASSTRGRIKGDEASGDEDAAAGRVAAADDQVEGKKHDREAGDVVHVLLTADMGQGEEDGSNALLQPQHPALNTTGRMTADMLRGQKHWDASAVGGVGSKTDAESLMKHFAPTLGLHIGDISYAQGYGSQWDNFYTQMEPLASHIPWMMAPGNHERDFPGSGDRYEVVRDSGGECGVPYEKRAIMPIQGPDQPWYSFNWGPIHFAMFSTEHATGHYSPQYKWLEADLKGVDRRIIPWVVLNGHRPMYVSSTNKIEPDGEQPVAQALRDDLEQLILDTQVDLVLAGHHHTYQRTCPVARGRCQEPTSADQQEQRAPIYVIIGHGGKEISLNLQIPPPPTLVKSAIYWGYARMVASPDILRVDVISDFDGSLQDSFTLKSRQGPSSK